MLRAAGIAMLAFVAAFLLWAAYSALSNDGVRFTLTFEDCPVPDMSSYQALTLHGAGFEYEKKPGYECVLYEWFARALLDAELHMALTYRGYVQDLGCNGIGPNSDLKSKATELVAANQNWGCEERLIGVLSRNDPYGMPYPWALPKIQGKCYSKVVWDAAYWDLAGQFGSEGEKRRLLSVEANYDWARRLRVNGHVPSIVFEDADIGFRLAFRDGVDGRVFARLSISYPSAKGLLATDLLVANSYDPIMRFVFSEMKKAENRGRTISGRFEAGCLVYNSEGVVGKVYVDGQNEPVLSVQSCIRPTRQECIDLQSSADVPDEAYARQYELREVKFSPGLKRIGACAFAGCGMLCYGQGALQLPEGLENIGDGAFARCSHIRSVELPPSVTNLGAWAFAECSALRQVTLPSGLGEIPDGLFYRYHEQRSGLESVSIPATVRRIGKYAFASNTRLTEIELPESVEEIDNYAFFGCESLTNVVMHGKLKRIGEAAFWGCEKLKRPELPLSVELGEEAFGGWIPTP